MNDSERILHKLGTRTFLSLWSITNPLVNRGATKPPEELCDLLVIYENHVLIFSDKYIGLDAEAYRLDPEEQQVKWKRWYKRAVQESIKQVYGAERKIKTDPGKIFLDAKFTQPLADRLPDPEHMVFHRIVVANGAVPYLKKLFGRTGGLMLQLGQRDGLSGLPGVVTSKDMAKGFVHVFDEHSIQLVMQQLDTITDFVEYLTCKEELVSGTNTLVASEEQDILGSYFRGYQEDLGYGFHQLTGLNMVVLDGLWKGLLDSGAVKRRTRGNQHSYHWDRMIEELTHAYLDQKMHFPSHLTFQEAELALRALASQRRVHRRVLSNALHGAQLKCHQHPGNPLYRYFHDSLAASDAPSFYVVAMAQSRSAMNTSVYRERRLRALSAYLGRQLRDYPEAPVIVGIGASGIKDQDHTYDLVYITPSMLTKEDRDALLHDYELFEQNTVRGPSAYKHFQTEDFPGR